VLGRFGGILFWHLEVGQLVQHEKHEQSEHTVGDRVSYCHHLFRSPNEYVIQLVFVVFLHRVPVERIIESCPVVYIGDPQRSHSREDEYMQHDHTFAGESFRGTLDDEADSENCVDHDSVGGQEHWQVEAKVFLFAISDVGVCVG